MLMFSSKILMQGIAVLQFRLIATSLAEVPLNLLYVTFLTATADGFQPRRPSIRTTSTKNQFVYVNLNFHVLLHTSFQIQRTQNFSVYSILEIHGRFQTNSNF